MTPAFVINRTYLRNKIRAQGKARNGEKAEHTRSMWAFWTVSQHSHGQIFFEIGSNLFMTGNMILTKNRAVNRDYLFQTMYKKSNFWTKITNWSQGVGIYF